MATRVKGFKPWAINRTPTVTGVGTSDARASMSALLSTSDLSVIRSGVVPSGVFFNANGTSPASGLLFATSPNSMAVDFNRLKFVVASSDGTGYVGGVNADGSLDIGASHASLTRIDLYVGRIYDADNSLGAERESYVEIVPGTPGAGAPAVPSGAVEIGRVSVGPGVTSIAPAAITFPNLRYTSALGGIRPVLSAVGAAEGDYPGAYRDYLGNLQRYMGKDSGGVDLGWLTVGATDWTPWTPTLKSTVRNCQLGTGGSVNGEYMVVNKACKFRVEYNFGSSNVDGGAGDVFVEMPVTGRAGRNMCQSYLVSPGGTFGGFGAVLSDEGRIYPNFPAANSTTDNRFGRLRNALANGTIDCNPKQPPGFFAIDKGGRLVVAGEYAVA